MQFADCIRAFIVHALTKPHLKLRTICIVLKRRNPCIVRVNQRSECIRAFSLKANSLFTIPCSERCHKPPEI